MKKQYRAKNSEIKVTSSKQTQYKEQLKENYKSLYFERIGFVVKCAFLKLYFYICILGFIFVIVFLFFIFFFF